MTVPKLLVIMMSFFISGAPGNEGFSSSTKTYRSNSNGNGFAVLELFTSEGCSSCPAADELVGKLNGTEKEVYVLCFHVDYWDYLGWKDPYSSEQYTSRQKEYGNRFQLNSIYTPQMIVNGKQQFVGSDEARLKETIESALQETPKNTIRINPVSATNKEIILSCNISGNTGNLLQDDFVLNLALVQKTSTDHIQRGENSGRTLQHFYIVRDFKSFPKYKNDEPVALHIPKNLKPSDYEVIGFLQNIKSGEIVSAGRN